MKSSTMNLLSRLRIQDLRLNPKERQRGAPRLQIMASSDRGKHETSCLSLPEGVHNRATFLTNDVVIPDLCSQRTLY